MLANKKARPGDEVAGFCTTSRSAYVGSVRSSRLVGTGMPVSAKKALS